MLRKICDVFSRSGEYKNEMILSRFHGKRLHYHRFFYMNMAFFDFLNSQLILLASFNFADL